MAKSAGGIALGLIALVFGVYTTAQHGPGENQTFYRSGLQEVARRQCEVMHPVETMHTADGVQVCERQHLVRQAGAACKTEARANGSRKEEDQTDYCDETVAYWGKSNHDYTDRFGETPPFASDPRWWPAFTDENNFNLEAAYKAGAYGLDWTIILVDFGSRSKAALAPLKFDGVSNFLYYVGWIINVPQKYLHQAIHDLATGRFDLLLDLAIGLILLPIQIAVATFCTAVGVIAGSIWNPLDTITAIPGGIVLLGWSVCKAIGGVFTAFGDGLGVLWAALKSLF